MTTPATPLPVGIEKWIARAAYLRWADAVAGWVVVLVIAMPTMRAQSGRAVVLTSLGAFAVGLMLRPLTVRWRPISGGIGLMVSRALRAGDRAWFVRQGRADPVLITARHGVRLSIAGVDLGEAESISVRRTRVLVIPAAGDPSRRA